MEAFSVATQRNFGVSHPIHRLLSPHIEGTNFINQAAASNLIAAGGPIDGIFANDRPSRLASLQGVAVRGRFNFDFKNRAPDVDFVKRKVERLKTFPYRDDVLLIWEAITRWATAYVDLYYDHDDAVEDDDELAHWSLDLVMHAGFYNFDPPTTKAMLSRTLAMVMFVSSAQHAAMNFPQSVHMSYAPAMSAAIWDEIPPAEEGASTEQQWLKLLPPIELAKEQLNTLYVLGSVRYRRLGEYHSNVFPYLGTLEAKAKPALERFREELRAIETVIAQRNQHRGVFAYDILLPSKIPPSVNI